MQVSAVTQRPGLATIMRSLLIGCAVVMAIVLLLWLHQEQEHVHRCSEVISQKNAGQQTAPPVHVVIHLEGPNTTNNTTVLPPSGGRWNYNWDHRAWKDPSEANGVPARTIILVRHGQYDLNTGLLNARGRQQANLTGIRLRDLNMAYDQIIHSDMIRAVETADIIHRHLPNLPKHLDPIIAEGGPTPPDPTVGYWSLPERTYYVEGVRIEAAFRKYFHRADKSQKKESTDILVGHGNIFRYLILRALQLPAAGWMRVFLPHGSISLLHINSDGTVTLTKFGDSGHFPPDHVTI